MIHRQKFPPCSAEKTTEDLTVMERGILSVNMIYKGRERRLLMRRKTFWKTAVTAVLAFILGMIPVHAQLNGGGPYGDIEGNYTWEINGKGWTVYSQNGYSWVYDDYGNRTYLDAYGNKLDGISAAAARTIAEMRLTYYGTFNGTAIYSNPNNQLFTVGADGQLYPFGGSAPQPQNNDYVMHYSYTSSSGYNIYRDDYGNYWWFSAGGIPNRWYGNNAGSWWRTDVHDYVYSFAYRSAEGYNLYRDDYGSLWWFGTGGVPHQYKEGSGSPSSNPNGRPAEINVDWRHSNTMEADGRVSTVYVNQYWQAPSNVFWAPEGMKLIGWDYAENTGYVRWKPGEWIKNTGSDLHLYPVYGR